MKPGLKLVIHWPRFGPYHLARLRAVQAKAETFGFCLIGMEIASRDKTYLWREELSNDLERQVIFPGYTREDVEARKLWMGVFRMLGQIRPDVVAINGYSAPDALAILSWCRMNGRPAILMTESKADDAPRSRWKEGIKKIAVNQFAAGLCGGTPHKAYLERLGMASSRIFTGYDAVDNDYFSQTAENVRRNSGNYRFLPGLESSLPFFLASARFILRKNLDGLLYAYGAYRQRLNAEQIPWRLVLLGDGEERQNLEKIVQAEGIEGVSFAGFRQIDEIPAYYGLAGAFIHPPHQEQWGLVVNEAMASGLPVLVSKTCGCAPDLVSDGINGFIFDSQNREYLTSLMLKISTEQTDIAAMGRASRQRIAEWGPAHFADGFLSAVQAAVA